MNPWTWDQFVDAAKRLTFDTAGRTPLDSGFNPDQIRTFGARAPTFWLFLMPFLYSNNAAFGNADGSATGLDSPQGKEVIQSISDLIHKYRVAPDAAMAATLPSLAPAFQHNQFAMAISGTWEYRNLMEEDVNFGVAPLPMFEKPMNIAWSATNQISAKTEHPEEVAKFLEFMVDPDDNPRQLYINFPNEIAWHEDPEKLNMWLTEDRFLPDFIDILPTILTQIAIVPENVTLRNFNRLVNEIAVAELEKVFVGEQSVEEAVDAIVKLSEGYWQGIN